MIGQSNIKPEESSTEAVELQPNKKKRSQRVSKSRPAARPYKKLEGAILKDRIEDCRRKIKLFESKTVILKDRMGAYEREEGLRLQLEQDQQ